MIQSEKMGRNLVWHDEFEKDSLDKTKWSFERLMFNPGLVYDNSEKNITAENGMLHLKVTKSGDKISTCNSVTTKNNMLFRYGYVEMRAKLPFCKGAWPSFWLKGDTKYITVKENRNNWFSEIDIVEVFSKLDTVSPNLHRWGKIDGEECHEMLPPEVKGQPKRYTFKSHEIAANEFHTYGMLWEKDKISFFVDDNMYFSADIDENCLLLNDKRNDTLGFHDPHYLIINNEVFTTDLSWYPEGSPITANDDIDINYYVDYVRLYQIGDDEKIYLT